MKKFNKLCLILILLFSSLNASGKLYSFMGIQTSNTYVKSKSLLGIGMKYGVQSRKYRTTLSYSYAQQSQTNHQLLLAQVDVGIFVQTFRNSKFKPYTGGAFGLVQEKNDAASYEDKGYVYGASIGVTYIYNDDLDFDLAYRYLKTSKAEEIDNIRDLGLSIHYFY